MSSRQEQIDRFWSKYLDKLGEQGIKPGQRRWYVLRAEAFVKGIQPRRLAELAARDVEDYLSRAGRDTRLSVWQFRQLVDAIRNLGETADAAWVGDLDWAHWRASAETLAADHPTVARDYGQEVAGLEPAGPMQELAEMHAQHQAVMDQMVPAIRRRGYSIRTERSYCDWVLRFIAFHGGRAPASLGGTEVGRFLDWLAVKRKVSASTQNQALNGLLFLFREVLGREGMQFGDFARAKRPKRLPTVLTKAEVARLLGALAGEFWLMASLAYGAGMRLMEVLRLRVQDLHPCAKSRRERGAESIGWLVVAGSIALHGDRLRAERDRIRDHTGASQP